MAEAADFFSPPISFNLSHPVGEEVYTPEFNLGKYVAHTASNSSRQDTSSVRLKFVS